MPRFIAVRQMAARLRTRQISARELLANHVRRIEERNPELNAIVTLTLELAAEQALVCDEAAARGEFLGPLHGLPVAFKDLQETRGIRTTFGSPVFADYVPDFDTELVETILQAGAVCLGKTNTPEFGAGSQTFNPVFGKTRNPHDPSKTCGGSSGGAAVALATGMVALADGNDTGGSLRNPASFCGVTGLRPTPGLVVGPERPLTVNGPMARTVDDMAYFLGALTGVSTELRRSFNGTRVAWCGDLGLPFEPAVLGAVAPCRRALEDLGCVTEDAAPDLAAADFVFRTLRAQEFLQVLGPKLAGKEAMVKETVRLELERGARLTAGEVESAYQQQRTLINGVLAMPQEFFVLPTVQVLPFDIEQPYVTEINGQKLDSYIDWMRSCYYVSVLGMPALSVPVGFSASGLPVGLQIVGRPGRDWEVLQLGHALQQYLA